MHVKKEVPMKISLPKMSKLKNVSISNKISIAIILCTVVVGLVLGALIYFQSESLLKIEAERNLTSILNREAEAIDNEFARVKRLSLVLRSMVTNTIDVPLAKTGDPYMAGYEEHLSGFFRSAISDFDNISGWVLFNSDVIPGANTVSYTYEEGAFIREKEYDVISGGFAEESWWQNAIITGENWTAPYYWQPWRADIITYSIPIYMDDQLIGVTGAELFMKPFQERLKNIRVYDTGFVMLITKEGNQVYLPGEADTAFFDSWYQTNKKNIAMNPEGVQYLEVGGRQEVLAWNTLENGWVLIARPKVEEMFGGLASLNYITIATMVSAIPLAVLLGLLISRSLTKRLGTLTTAAHLLLDHQTEIVLDDTHGDEIGTLTRAFVQMQQQVRTTLSQLTVNEAKYRSLVENAESMIYTIDLEGCFLTTNRRLEMMVGLSKEELIGKNFTKIFESEANRNYWTQAFKQLITTGDKSHHENIVENAQGEQRTIITALIPILNQDGKIAMVMGTTSDITERINAEKKIAELLTRENVTLEMRVNEKAKALENALKELMEVDKLAALGRLVAGVSHEINTPLGNAITLSSFLEQHYQEITKKIKGGTITSGDLAGFMEVVNESIDGITRNLNRTAILVNDFKSMSIEKTSNSPVAINLNHLLNIGLLSLKHEYQPLKVQVHVECDPDLMVQTDPSAITHILTNLVINAVKHAFDGVPHPTLTVTVTQQPQTVTIAFGDNGKGMDKEVVSHIFEPFFTTKRGQGSSGLGLSIVYNTVTTTLKGRILCESAPNSGTLFVLTIPK